MAGSIDYTDDGRFGSFATKLDRPRHVRSPPDSDQTADMV